MQCYLMRSGQIQAIATLDDGPDDDAIEQAIAMLRQQARRGIDGIEVWSGQRFVYRVTIDEISR